MRLGGGSGREIAERARRFHPMAVARDARTTRSQEETGRQGDPTLYCDIDEMRPAVFSIGGGTTPGVPRSLKAVCILIVPVDRSTYLPKGGW